MARCALTHALGVWARTARSVRQKSRFAYGGGVPTRRDRTLEDRGFPFHAPIWNRDPLYAVSIQSAARLCTQLYAPEAHSHAPVVLTW